MEFDDIFTYRNVTNCAPSLSAYDNVLSKTVYIPTRKMPCIHATYVNASTPTSVEDTDPRWPW